MPVAAKTASMKLASAALASSSVSSCSVGSTLSSSCVGQGGDWFAAGLHNRIELVLCCER